MTLPYLVFQASVFGPSGMHVARKEHGEPMLLKLTSCPATNLFIKFLLTSFATNMLPECHKWGQKQKEFLLTSHYARNIVSYPHSQKGGTARHCNG